MNISDTIFAGIGKVVVAWATLEHNMASFTLTMVSPDIDTGICLTKELRFRALCDAMLNVFRIHIGEGEDFEELKCIVISAERLEPQRNKLVHSTFQPDQNNPDKARLWKVSAKRKGIKRISEQITETELKALTVEIHKLSNSLLGIFKRLYATNRFKYFNQA